jgi:membrane fusion protein, multidrug efflux system
MTLSLDRSSAARGPVWPRASNRLFGVPHRFAHFLVLGLPIVVACGSGDAVQQGSGRGPGGMAMGADRVVPVETTPVQLGEIARRVTVSGVVEPIRTVGVNSQLATAVLSIRAEEGDRVETGQILATLDDREIAAQVASAEANFRIAESTYRRTQQLRERQIVTQAEYDRDFAAYLTTQAQLEQFQTRLEYATVRAPFSGVITDKLVEAGDVVGNQTRLFTIADVSTMVVRVRVSELDVVDLRPGDDVQVALDAFPRRAFDGRVRRVFPAADPESRLVPVEVEMRGEGTQLGRPGFLARTTFALSARENALLIPSSALVTGTGGTTAVFVINEDRARRRTVTTGLTSEGRIEILSGLTEGEVVVSSGTTMVRDGGAVRMVNTGSMVTRPRTDAVSSVPPAAGPQAGPEAETDRDQDPEPEPAPDAVVPFGSNDMQGGER